MSGATIPLRKDLPENMCWDLSPMYQNDEEWEADFKQLDVLLKKHLACRGHLAESPEMLKQGLDSADELGLLEEKLFVYAHLKNDEDTSNSANSGRLDRISAKGADISGQTAWFEPELMAMPQERFTELRKHPVLAFYARTLADIERDRKHTLSEPEERLLGMSGEVFGTPEKAFSMLNDADLQFPKVRSATGKRVPLTHGNYNQYLESPNRAVRKSAFKATYDTYSAFKNTFAAMLDGTVKANVLNAKLRHYPSALEASLSGGNIPKSVYTNLISSVRTGLPELYRYFSLRAKTLGLKKLEMYDLHTPLVPAATMKFTWNEAKDCVREACKPLGKEYGTVLEHAFKERWIDVLECKSKRSGAYSSGCYGYAPYLLLNFNGTLDSVSTLAHELGHSMHSYFSDHAQKYHYAAYHLFAAEIASTTNELLLSHSLMQRTADKKVRAYLLSQRLDDFRTTMYRQTMFAEFEAKIYEMAENGEPLTPDSLCELYYKLNGEYHGPAVKNTDAIRYEWSRIPHFHYNFYVYQYATGISAAAALAQAVLNGENERYLNFLKAGDSKDVIDILKDAGVDFSTPEPVDAAIRLFSSTLNELEKIL